MPLSNVQSVAERIADDGILEAILLMPFESPDARAAITHILASDLSSVEQWILIRIIHKTTRPN